MSSANRQSQYCNFCRRSFTNDEEYEEHAWSFLHHKNINKQEKGFSHKCGLCQTSNGSLINYKQHVNGKKHMKALVKWRHENNVKNWDHFSEERGNDQRKHVKDGSLYGMEYENPCPSLLQLPVPDKSNYSNFTTPRRGRYRNHQSKNFLFHQSWNYADFSGNSFEQEPHWENRGGFNRGMGPPQLFNMGRGNWHRNFTSYGGSGPTDFSSDEQFYNYNVPPRGRFPDKQDVTTWHKETNFVRKESDQDNSEVDIEDFRSSIAKKADLSTPSSTDNVDTKTKSTLDFSAKTSQIIDDVLMGRPPKPKIVTKKDLELSKVPSLGESTGEKKVKSNKRTQLLEKAERICEQSRIKRQQASQARTLKDNTARAEDAEQLNREIDQLTKRAMGSITRDSDGFPEDNSSRACESDVQKKLQKSTVNNNSFSVNNMDNIPRNSSQRNAGLSLHIPDVQMEISDAKSHKRLNAPLLSPPGSKSKTKLGKDHLKKLVTAPRSRKEQMLVAKIMQNYTKAKPSLRSRLAAGSDPQSDLESPIQVEDLPDDVQMQIAQLLEEEAEGDFGESDIGAMDIAELEVNKACNVIDDSEDDLEMVMILDDESRSQACASNKPAQDDENYIEIIEQDEQSDNLTKKSESHVKIETGDTSSNSTNTDPSQPKRRRQRPDTDTSKETQESPDSVQRERDSVSKRARIDTKSDSRRSEETTKPNDEHRNERTTPNSVEQMGNGTVERLLDISLQEESVRNRLVKNEQEIQELHVMLMQAQQQLQSKMALREQLTREEAKLRDRRMNILKGAVSDKTSGSGSLSSSQQSHTIQQVPIKEESTSPRGKEAQVVIREPDTTTLVGSSPDASPKESFSGCTGKIGTDRVYQSFDMTQTSRHERTLSQSSADQSADGEYTAQYVGTLEVDTEHHLLNQLAANLADMQQASYMIVNEGDIENSDCTSDFMDSTKDGCSSQVNPSETDSTRGHKNVDKFCEVKLERLDPTITKSLRNGSPVIVNEEEEDTSRVVVKTEPADPPQIPSSPNRKKRKTKKERDRSRSKVKTAVPVLSSECSGIEDVSHTETSLPVNRVKRRSKKLTTSPDSKLLHEYLHASSSSDVELDNAEQTSKIEGKPSVAEHEKLKIKPGQMAALRLSAQKTSFCKKQQTDEEQKDALMEPQTKKYKGHSGTVHCMQVSDGYLFTGSADHTARKFNLKTFKCEAVYSAHSKGVQCLCIYKQPLSSPKLITGSFDSSIIVFDVETVEQEKRLMFQSRVLCMCEYNEKLYVGLFDGTISVISLATMTEIDTMQGSDQGVRCIRTAKEGTRDLLMVASVDGSISIRDMRSGLFFRSIMGHTKTPLDMQVVNHLLYSAGADKTVQIHDINTGEFIESFSHRGVVTSVWVQDDYLYTGGYESIVRCYNNKKFEKLYYGADKGVITSMVVHDNKLYTGNKEGTIESICLPDKDVRWTCKFNRCAKVFGLKEHLEHHVFKDHVISSQLVVKCLWEDCESYLYVQDKKQETMEHILHHLDE